MKKFIYVLMTIIQYIAFGAAIYLWRFQHQKAYIVAGAFALMFFAFWGKISVKEDKQKQREKDRKKRYIDSSFARALSIPYSKVMNDRGMYGEYCTSTYYTDIDACDYRVLYSVYIPTDDDIGSTEIDSLIITPYGLFVNEIKNRKLGWSIYGDYQEADAKHRDGSVSTEKSPVYQNKNHMKALRIYMERHLHNELAILNNRILGCVALGPETLFSDTEIVYQPTNQTVCSFRKIGIKINGVLKRSKQAGCTNYEARYMAMERVYKELLKYQNNRSLKKRHDRVVKQMGWQSNVTYA